MQTARKIHAHLVRVAPGLASAGCYGSMFFAVHFIAGRLPATQIIFTRAAVTSLVLFPSVIGKFRQITSRSALPLWLRSFAVEFSTVCFTWNLQHTSVGLANALYNLAPLFVLLAAWQIKTERRSFSRFISLLFVVSGGYVFWIGTSLHARVSAEVWVIGVTGAAAAALRGVHSLLHGR
jgi:drug/metabolite transporter (DMT)-like permease